MRPTVYRNGKLHVYMCTASDMNFITFFRGSDFRKSYSQIGVLRSLTKAPFMALTASAPSATMNEISTSLCLNSPVLVFRNLNRENTYLSVGTKLAINVSQTN